MAFRRDPSDRLFRRYCETGDPGALGAVFDRTAGRLMKVALWLSGNRTDAEDLLQRTFLRAIETRRQFLVGEPVLPWLMGLLGNQARSMRRERERAAAGRPVRDKVVDPEVDVVANELTAAVRSVGDRLGEPYRDVLHLHLQSGLNAKEIAARLDRPAGTVPTQLMRALEQLRRRLPRGFAAGLAATGSLDPSAMAGVRASVVNAAELTAPVPLAVAAASSSGGPLLGNKLMMMLTAFAILAGTAAYVSIQSEEPLPSSTPSGHFGSAGDARPDAQEDPPQPSERVAVTSLKQGLDPVDLPRLMRLGAKPKDAAVMALTAQGRLSELEDRAGDSERVLLRVDRDAPWEEVTKLLDRLRARGVTHVAHAPDPVVRPSWFEGPCRARQG